MTDYNYRNREKENAKEWQTREEAGIQKGDIHAYFHGLADDDQTSESANEGPALQQAPQLSTRPHPPPRNLTHFQKVNYKKAPSKQKKKQAITFANKRDNAAKVSYRSGQPPLMAFDLGRPLRDIEPSVARIQNTFEEVGVRFGSFVLPQRSLKETKILVWGNQKQIDDTLRELERWRSRASSRQSTKESRPSAKDPFAKVFSTSGYIWVADEDTAQRNSNRQHYQKAPQQGQRFKANGYFLWPNNEVRATDLFGPHCEALDPIRMEHKVYIQFDESRSVFKIHTNKGAERVNHAIQRIENTIKEYVARDHRPATLLLIEPLSPADYRPNVQTIAGPSLGVSGAQSRIPVLHGGISDPKDISHLQLDVENLTLKNKNRMYVATQGVLERIPYYRGGLRIRVNFGTFALIKFQWPPGVHSVALERFTADVQTPGTKGTLIRNIRSDRTPQDILDCFHQAGDLFQAVSTKEENSAEVPPQYAAMFYLRHPEKMDEMIQLEVIFITNDDNRGNFESSKTLWIKGGKSDATTQAPPLEAFHIRLRSGISWQLRISSENILDMSRITPEMEDFAQGVQFKRPPAEVNPAVSGYKVFTSPPHLPILGMEQKTTFRYSLKTHPSCIFELSRYDEYNGDDPSYPSSTKWAATFYDREWDVNLGENARLSIGQSASWNPRTNPFFQPRGGLTSQTPSAGFTECFHNAQAIASFLDKLKGTVSD